ncbi:MAG: Uma2 family endonuclease [Oscillibacter sp.]|nr:Uma2 family endonuclease [Oscillibacter sp.]
MQTNLAYEEESREEIINGKAVMMTSPTINHNFVVANIFRIFDRYLDGKRCTPFADNTTVFLSEKERYIPDFMIVRDPDKIKIDGVHGAPDLVAEVLSPSTGWNDKTHKKDVYEQFGVREYWIVSPGERSVEQYILTDGRYELRDIYYQYPDWMLKNMREEERTAIVKEFRCSLFEDLPIVVDEIFQNMIPG